MTNQQTTAQPIILRRALPLLLACAILMSLFALPAAAKSGAVSVSSPTKAEIIQRYQSIRTATTVYKTKPSLTAPYAAGELSDSMLQNALDYFNYLRFLAGLPEVSMSAAMNDEAQHGAALLVASDQFTHYPQKPADMSQAFYNKAYSATTSANLAGSYAGPDGFWNEATNALHEGIQGCMQDDSGYDNLTTVGHRRWFLNPWMKYIGFGFADNTEARVSVIKAHDRSGSKVDYNYVAWPPAGYCPSNEFPTMTPWSVSLNPEVYDWINRDAVKVTIHSKESGETWVVDKNTPIGNIGEAYLQIADSMYGEGECIIFMPDFEVDEEGFITMEDRMGEYSVSITGLHILTARPPPFSTPPPFLIWSRSSSSPSSSSPPTRPPPSAKR